MEEADEVLLPSMLDISAPFVQSGNEGQWVISILATDRANIDGSPKVFIMDYINGKMGKRKQLDPA